MPRLEIRHWLAIGVVAMALGWTIAILVWEPLGLALVLGGAAIFAVVIRVVGNQYIEKYRQR